MKRAALILALLPGCGYVGTKSTTRMDYVRARLEAANARRASLKAESEAAVAAKAEAGHQASIAATSLREARAKRAGGSVTGPLDAEMRKHAEIVGRHESEEESRRIEAGELDREIKELRRRMLSLEGLD